MLNKVMKAKAEAERKAAERAAKRPDTLTSARQTASLKAGNTKAGTEEARRLRLAALALSKPGENGGMDYAVDARKQRKADKPGAYHYRKESVFSTQVKTHGKTDATINSYYRNKRSDNMPREIK